MPAPRRELLSRDAYQLIFAGVFGVSPDFKTKVGVYIDDNQDERISAWELELEDAMNFAPGTILFDATHLVLTHAAIYEAMCTVAPTPPNPEADTYPLAGTDRVHRTCGCSGCRAGTTCLQIVNG